MAKRKAQRDVHGRTVVPTPTGWREVVVCVHVAPDGGETMRAVGKMRVVEGWGLEGDRYFGGTGFYSDHPGPIREVSLFEEETIEALECDHSLEVEPGETRRNILTRGVPRDHLVGRAFHISGAVLKGVEFCEPCKHLVGVTGKRSMLPILIHRRGLHAQVLQSGIVNPGDEIEEVREEVR